MKIDAVENIKPVLDRGTFSAKSSMVSITSRFSNVQKMAIQKTANNTSLLIREGNVSNYLESFCSITTRTLTQVFAKILLYLGTFSLLLENKFVWALADVARSKPDCIKTSLSKSKNILYYLFLYKMPKINSETKTRSVYSGNTNGNLKCIVCRKRSFSLLRIKEIFPKTRIVE